VILEPRPARQRDDGSPERPLLEPDQGVRRNALIAACAGVGSWAGITRAPRHRAVVTRGLVLHVRQ
jgi:hypothetical protein